LFFDGLEFLDDSNNVVIEHDGTVDELKNATLLSPCPLFDNSTDTHISLPFDDVNNNLQTLDFVDESLY